MNLSDSAFFTDFAIDVTVNGLAARGIFDNAYGSAFGGMVDGSGPHLTVPASVNAGPGDSVFAAGKNWTITTVEKDGPGLDQILRLTEA